MNVRIRLLPLLLIVCLFGCSAPLAPSDGTADAADILAEPAEQFVKLSLALGQHDRDYVDAYSGPADWQDDAVAKAKPLAQIALDADVLSDRVAAIRGLRGIDGKRQRLLAKQFSSLAARARIVGGQTLSFDQETQALYDAVAPTHTERYFTEALEELSDVLPGTGTVSERLTAFKEQFVISPDRLDAVFEAAIDECRRRTLQHITLPDYESFTVEYVTGKSWSGYNWFQGNAKSLIQVNTELPIYVDRAVDLACHEGYPGHHVYNTLLEQNLTNKRGWIEFSVFPLFSPTGLIAEGTANYGIDLAFSDEERMAFEASVVFPLAGLDASRVHEYYAVLAAVEKLKFASNYTARRYLDGALSAPDAAKELAQFALMSPEKAQQHVRFIDQYRSYVINYTLGKDLVAAWIERDTASSQPGQADIRARKRQRWNRFTQLLIQPTLPSELLAH